MLGRYKLHWSVFKRFSGQNNLEGLFYVLVNFIAVWAKKHKSEDQNTLRMISLRIPSSAKFLDFLSVAILRLVFGFYRGIFG